MMRQSKEEIQKIKKEYPPGTVIELINMDDPNPVPSGTIGTVYSVDDIGQIHCEEFHLAIVPGKDEFEKVGYTKRCRYCLNLSLGRTFVCMLNNKQVDIDDDSCEDFKVVRWELQIYKLQ